MKHGEKTVQFYEKYESFLRDRCLIEDEYARALKKLTKTYTPKAKEQEEFYNKLVKKILSIIDLFARLDSHLRRHFQRH